MSGMTTAERVSEREPAARGLAERVVLLGPQSLKVTLGEVVDSLDLGECPIASITSGWQEREAEVLELDAQLRRRSFNLQLYRRAETVFAQDRELAERHHAQQAQLKELRRLYRIRLEAAMEAVLTLLQEPDDSELIEPEREAAMDQLRQLDAWHLRRIAELRQDFDARFTPRERPAVVRQRHEIEAMLADAPVVALAGGHVAVLQNRLHLFGVDRMLAGKLIIAWSAGAMVLSERVVLFHDDPPQGAGSAEVFDNGFGLFPGVVALPHGRRRLKLANRERVRRFARRFVPARCCVMHAGTRMDWDGQRWSAPGGVVVLCEDGGLEVMKEW